MSTAAHAAPILLATDGRGATDAPLLAAERLAAQLGAPLHVVAVAEPIAAYGTGYEPYTPPPELDAEQRAALRDVVRRRLAPLLGAGDRWHLDVRTGTPAREIADAARECGARLIVLGVGGQRFVDRLLDDRVAAQVVRRTAVPVLAVAPDLRPPLRRAVVAVDFGAPSVRAAQTALALLEPEAHLTLVHVRGDEEPPAEARLAELRESLGTRRGVTIETRERVGRVIPCLRLAAEQGCADFVAVGTHGPGWVERLVLGSVAAEALRDAGTTVLVTPSSLPSAP